MAADIPRRVEPDDDLLSKAARVQGNPFLMVEFFRGLQDDHLVSFDSGRASLVSGSSAEACRGDYASPARSHGSCLRAGRDVRVRPGSALHAT